MQFLLLTLVISLSLLIVKAVDRSKFRTCQDSSFCRRYRHRAPISHEAYSIDKSSLHRVKSNQLIGEVRSSLASSPLRLSIEVQRIGSVRLKITENIPRWQPPDILQASSLIDGEFTQITDIKKLPSHIQSLSMDSFFAIEFESSFGDPCILIIYYSPFKIDLFVNEVLQISINDRSLMQYELKQTKLADEIAHHQDTSEEDRHQGKEIAHYGEDGLAIYTDGSKEERRVLQNNNDASNHDSWSESFGGHTDSRPNGPMSVSIDVSFPFAQHVYGLPEHTSPLSLPTTIESSASIKPYYSEPYRLYNLDVFEYELDQTMALYGNIPFLLAHGIVNGKGISTGIFWFNPSETFVDISDGSLKNARESSSFKETHWISESGEIDIFLLPGDSPKTVMALMTHLTGRQQLPPMFSLGYHQCRWNYRDEKDVADVEKGFEDLDFPMDVIWLDIEHTNGKRYFTWDSGVFPNPIEMQKNISAHGRKMVTIVDPHIKRDSNYHIHSEATSLGLYIKSKDGVTDFNGWCWPGDSSYLDFTNEKVRDWWAKQFALDKYIGSTLDLFTWNDMNEPSVFNGPEVSMAKDNLNLEGIEHREWHNLYGIYMQQATGEGLMLRTPSDVDTARPFVLSRSFWAGSQKYGAIWTGDNESKWSHLKIASPMLLSINIAGLSFAGADVGGFFGNAEAELFSRWFQAGSFTPFFRGHAHHDSKRREPWVYGDPYTNINRKAAMIRYSLLPYWYTVFYEAYAKGFPVMRPLFSEFMDDITTFSIDDQWLIGDALLVKPVTDEGKLSELVYLPGSTSEKWYNFNTLYSVETSAASNGHKISVDAPLDTIPVFIRGGKIIPRKLRLRRSSKLMFHDPYTMMIALDQNREAVGYLYLDDETSLNHEKKGSFILRQFSFKDNIFSSSRVSWNSDHIESTKYHALNTIERLVVLGVQSKPQRIILQSEGAIDTELRFNFHQERQIVIVKKPDVKVTSTDWKVIFKY